MEAGNIIEHISDDVDSNKCIHGKRKIICRSCKGAAICIHGRQKYVCIDCKGSLICQHLKVKYICKECNPKYMCEHNKTTKSCNICNNKYYCIHKSVKKSCKLCNKHLLCGHDSFKYLCKLCKGTHICSHGRQKPYCKECGGSQYCEHGKRKSICKECNGTQLCEHSKTKYTCVDCKGASICIHNKNKATCRICKPSILCIHNISEAYCKACKGSQICIHNKYKKRCIECKGSLICIHNKNKYSCKLCDGRNLCKSSWCETAVTKKYNGYCLQCTIHLFPEIQVSQNYKTKEITLKEAICNKFPEYNWIYNKAVSCNGTRRLPDLLLDLSEQIIIVEIDENQHKKYDCSCENKRLVEISQSLNHKPIVFIRFNPDSYKDISGTTISSCWKIGKDGILRLVKSKEDDWSNRLEHLYATISYWITNTTSKLIEVIQLFYNQNIV